MMIRHAPLSQRELNDEYKLFSLQSDNSILVKQ